MGHPIQGFWDVRKSSRRFLPTSIASALVSLWKNSKVPFVDGDPIVNGPCGLCSFRVVTGALEDFLTVGASAVVAAWYLRGSCTVFFFPDGWTSLYFLWIVAVSVWSFPLSFDCSIGGWFDAAGVGVWPSMGVPVGFGTIFIIFAGWFGLVFR